MVINGGMKSGLESVVAWLTPLTTRKTSSKLHQQRLSHQTDRVNLIKMRCSINESRSVFFYRWLKRVKPVESLPNRNMFSFGRRCCRFLLTADPWWQTSPPPAREKDKSKHGWNTFTGSVKEAAKTSVNNLSHGVCSSYVTEGLCLHLQTSVGEVCFCRFFALKHNKI